MPASVTVLSRDGRDVESVDLSPTEATVFGREPGIGIELDDTEVSRRHFEIVRAEGQWILRDLDSTNGTFVNGQRIAQTQLLDGQTIGVGKGRLRFNCSDTAAGQITEYVTPPGPQPAVRDEETDAFDPPGDAPRAPSDGQDAAVEDSDGQDAIVVDSVPRTAVVEDDEKDAAVEGDDKRIPCPKCNALLILPARANGKPVRCAVCEEDFSADSRTQSER